MSSSFSHGYGGEQVSRLSDSDVQKHWKVKSKEQPLLRYFLKSIGAFALVSMSFGSGPWCTHSSIIKCTGPSANTTPLLQRTQSYFASECRSSLSFPVCLPTALKESIVMRFSVRCACAPLPNAMPLLTSSVWCCLSLGLLWKWDLYAHWKEILNIQSQLRPTCLLWPTERRNCHLVHNVGAFISLHYSFKKP